MRSLSFATTRPGTGVQRLPAASGDKGERDPFVVLEHPVVRGGPVARNSMPRSLASWPRRLLWVAPTDGAAQESCHAQVICGDRHGNVITCVRRGFCANPRENQRREPRTPYSDDGRTDVPRCWQDCRTRRRTPNSGGGRHARQRRGEADEHERQNGLTDGVVNTDLPFIIENHFGDPAVLYRGVRGSSPGTE